MRLPTNEETKKPEKIEKIIRTIKLITPKKLKILKQRKIRKSTSSSDTDESVVLSKRRKSRRVMKMDKLKTITKKTSISKASSVLEKSSPKIVRKSAKGRGRTRKKPSDESPSTPKQQGTDTSPISDKQSEESTNSKQSQSTENQTSNTTSSAVVSVNETVSWTRDEDKIILQVKRASTMDEDDVICEKIRERLQNRELPDIINRYTFLMDVLKKMQK